MNGKQLETLCCGCPGYIAPEVLRKEGYGIKADVFSCGIILYYLYILTIYQLLIQQRLTGMSPLLGDTVEETIEKNKQCNITFPEELWNQVSPDGRDLVYQMTEIDPYKRMSAQGCLSHKWFSKKEARLNQLTQALARLKRKKISSFDV